jgi:hypothetical protein
VRYIVLSLLLAGCATQQFTEAGRQVRIINTSLAVSCQHLGMVTGWGPVLVGGMPYAQIQIRNRTAEKGANALAIVSQSVSPEGHGEVVGDAYLCR